MIGQYEVPRPFVTDPVRKLVRGRLLEGALKFVDTSTLRPGLKRDEVKLALLLVKIANPKEFLTVNESQYNRTVHIREVFQEKIAWDGLVRVFTLIGPIARLHR